MRRLVTVAGIALALVLGIMAYALMHDLFDGLPFTRSTESWGWWAGGLFVGGLFLLLIEATGEWLFGTDERWDRPRRTTRVFRVTAAALLLAVVVVAVAVLSK